MKNLPPPNYGSPFMTWDQVPKETRDDVVRLAEAGDFHPDVRLRRLAYKWAVDVAGQRSWAMWLLGTITAIGNGPADMRGEFRERRQARVIVALGNPDAKQQE